MLSIINKQHTAKNLNLSTSFARGSLVILKYQINVIFGGKGRYESDSNSLNTDLDLSIYPFSFNCDIVLLNDDGTYEVLSNINCTRINNVLIPSTSFASTNKDGVIYLSIIDLPLNFWYGVYFSYNFSTNEIETVETENERAWILSGIYPSLGTTALSNSLFQMQYLSSNVVKNPLNIYFGYEFDIVFIDENPSLPITTFLINFGNNITDINNTKFYFSVDPNIVGSDKRVFTHILDNHCVTENGLNANNLFKFTVKFKLFKNSFFENSAFEITDKIEFVASTDYNERFNALYPLFKPTNVNVPFDLNSFWFSLASYSFLIQFDLPVFVGLGTNIYIIIERYEKDYSVIKNNEIIPYENFFVPTINSEKSFLAGSLHYPIGDNVFDTYFLGYTGFTHNFICNISYTNIQRMKSWYGFRILLHVSQKPTVGIASNETHLLYEMVFDKSQLEFNPFVLTNKLITDSKRDGASIVNPRITYSQSLNILADITLKPIVSTIEINSITYKVIPINTQYPILFERSELPKNLPKVGKLDFFDNETKIFQQSDATINKDYRVGTLYVNTNQVANTIKVKIPVLFRVEDWIQLLPNDTIYYDTNENYDGFNHDFSNYGSVNYDFEIFVDIDCEFELNTGEKFSKIVSIPIYQLGLNYSLSRTAYGVSMILIPTNVTFEVNSIPTLTAYLDEIKGIFKVNNLPAGHYLYEVRIWKINSSNKDNHSFLNTYLPIHNREHYDTGDLNLLGFDVEWIFNSIGIYKCHFVFAYNNDSVYDYYTIELNVEIKERLTEIIPFLESKVKNDCCQVIDLPKYLNNNCLSNANIKDYFKIPFLLEIPKIKLDVWINNIKTSYPVLTHFQIISGFNNVMLVVFDLNQYLNNVSLSINDLDAIEINGIRWCFNNTKLNEFVIYELPLTKDIKIGRAVFDVNIKPNIIYPINNSYISNVITNIEQEKILFNSVNEVFNYGKKVQKEIEIQHEFIHSYERFLLELFLLQDYIKVYDGNERYPFNCCNGLIITNFNTFETETFEYHLYHSLKIKANIKDYLTNIC